MKKNIPNSINFYDRKKFAMEFIDQVAEEGFSDINQISFDVYRNFQLGDSFTKKYVDDMLKYGAFSKDDLGRIKKGDKNSKLTFIPK